MASVFKNYATSIADGIIRGGFYGLLAVAAVTAIVSMVGMLAVPAVGVAAPTFYTAAINAIQLGLGVGITAGLVPGAIIGGVYRAIGANIDARERREAEAFVREADLRVQASKDIVRDEAIAQEQQRATRSMSDFASSPASTAVERLNQQTANTPARNI